MARTTEHAEVEPQSNTPIVPLSKADNELKLALEETIAYYRFATWVLLERVPITGDSFIKKVLSFSARFVGNLRDEQAYNDAEVFRCFNDLNKETEAERLDRMQYEIAIDRTRILRNAQADRTMPVPCEGVFLGEAKPTTACASVSKWYRRWGFAIPASAHARPDFLGVELLFLEKLLESALAALLENDVARSQEFLRAYNGFIQEHITPWASKYCECAAALARTSFMKGFFLLTTMLIDGESELAQQNQEAQTPPIHALNGTEAF